MTIGEDQKELLLRFLPHAERYVESDDIDSLLCDLDARITEIGFDSNYDLNKVGLKLQRLYDELYNQN